MKKIVSIVLAVSMLAVCVTGCKTTTRKQLKPVVLNEVAHSIFYAPQYAAIELGYFEDEGLDLTHLGRFEGQEGVGRKSRRHAGNGI